ncbi:MAG: hypothetical protein HY914_17300 [Desulfomonile tiedjei]|nr:hypothetical protein [Desulfomonile tiedjei]
MIKKPLNVLVCLAILLTLTSASALWGYNGTGLPSGTAIQGDSLSVDPAAKTVPQVRPYGGTTVSSPAVSGTSSGSRHRTKSTGSRYSSNPQGYGTGTSRQYASLDQGYAPGNPASQGMSGPFAPCGISYGSSPCAPLVLPRVGPKQFQLDAKLWYATLNASTVLWGTIPGGFVATELNLHDDLGLSKQQYIPEFEGRFQLRCNWGVRMSYMPIQYKDTTRTTLPFYFGNLIYAAFVPIETEWNRNIWRAELIYDWFQAPHAVASIFCGYSLYDDKLTVRQPLLFQSRTRSQGFGLVRSGAMLDRVISKVGCGGAVASVHCEGALHYLEGYVGYDVYGTGRVSVPMGCGRFGYLEAGWRFMVLERSYPTNVDRTNMDGVIGAVGLVF